MGSGYPTRQPDSIREFGATLNTILERLAKLEAPTGTQTYDALSKVKQLIADLPTLVANLAAAGVTWAGPVNTSGAITTTADVTAANVHLGNNGTVWSDYALNNPVTTGYFALYVNADGRFGRTPSALKYKQDIANFTPAEQAVFAIQLRQFRLRQAVEEMGDAAPIEHGLIAEELAAVGLEWLVLYGPEGEPEGIAYEKVALALIPAIQDHETRLTALENGMVA
jgi:hypothetical protein